MTVASQSTSLRCGPPRSAFVSIENWSDNILVVELQDDPSFTDDMNALVDQLEQRREVDVVMDFAGVSYVNSSNIAKLLKVRKKVINSRRRLVICGIATNARPVSPISARQTAFQLPRAVAGCPATSAAMLCTIAVTMVSIM